VVSIIIPTYKDWDRLQLCLNALEMQSYPKNLFEVIVVNNDVSDIVPEKLKKYANVTFTIEPKPGSYAARNTGIRLSKGNIIGFTDSDCIPHKDWIKNAVEYLNENENCNRIAGKISIIKRNSRASIIELYNEIYSFPQEVVIKNHGGSMTANLFTYKFLFEKVSFFNDKLMSYGDLSWGSKVSQAGYAIDYVENIIVYHPPRSLKELIVKEKRLGGGNSSFQENKRPHWFNILKFFYSLRPSTRSLNLMFSLRKELTTKEVLLTPLIRYFLLVVRNFETLRVQLGKNPNRL
jgi:glycosyltransferase involved in cell wall biosynthesis